MSSEYTPSVGLRIKYTGEKGPDPRSPDEGTTRSTPATAVESHYDNFSLGRTIESSALTLSAIIDICRDSPLMPWGRTNWVISGLCTKVSCVLLTDHGSVGRKAGL